MDITTLETKVGAAGERFGGVVSTYRPQLLRQARNLTGRVSDAEDLVQDVFMKLMVFFQDKPLPEDRACAAWLTKTLNNSFFSRLRKDGVHSRATIDPTLTNSITPDEPAPQGLFETVSDGELSQAIESLSTKRREVFDGDAAGKSYAEIGRELGIAEGAVAKRLHDARKHLKKIILQARAGKAR